MPRLVVEDAKPKPQFELLEDGSIHEATVSNIEINSWTDPATSEVIKNLNWTFTLHTNGEWDGKRIWGNTSLLLNMHPSCKLRNWAQVILGVELPSGYELDTDELIGHKVRVVVARKNYKDKTGEQREKQFVGDVYPARRSASMLGEAGF